MSNSPVTRQVILGSLITGTFDVNRNEVLGDDDFSLVEKWVSSIQKAGLKAVLFHNGFSVQTCKKQESPNLEFVRVKPSVIFNPNVYRYFLYLDYLRKNASYITDLFVTDVSDVVMIQNPFSTPEYVSNPTTIFCGDEPKILSNEWMVAHNTHLRNQIENFGKYESDFAQETLLNCGIIGGKVDRILDLLFHLTALHSNYNQSNPTAYTGDMGAFNYLIRTQFGSKILHGFPVNTVFKAYQENREDCWFRHK